jgi:hypothetical protein
MTTISVSSDELKTNLDKAPKPRRDGTLPGWYAPLGLTTAEAAGGLGERSTGGGGSKKLTGAALI